MGGQFKNGPLLGHVLNPSIQAEEQFFVAPPTVYICVKCWMPLRVTDSGDCYSDENPQLGGTLKRVEIMTRWMSVCIAL